MIWCAVLFWYTSETWHIKRPFLTRITAHLSIIVVVLATAVFISRGIPEPLTRVSAAGGLPGTTAASLVTTSSPAHLEPAPTSTLRGQPRHSDVHAVSRMPDPHTIIPQRPRAQVITYVVRPGDTLFSIAAQFDLSTTTIVWSNREVFQDVPWLVRMGTELFILPVDGVYHTVRSGETTASIAADYGVEPADLYNEWNGLNRGKRPSAGQLLVVPGGKGEELAWPPLSRYPAPGLATYSYEVCNDEEAIGPGGHGWFTYPTGRSEVSGWVFHDRRNRMHIGIDYRCKQGDPIYAADNGVVTSAGRNGTYGIMIAINHGSGFVTRYGHFSRLAVACGQPVYQGDLIGYCGNTGWSSGAHLHFEIRQDNVPKDPEIYLPPLD
jgi:murein DD-endopeptidase MepM/ murein hydrolase activator NlpD